MCVVFFQAAIVFSFANVYVELAHPHPVENMFANFDPHLPACVTFSHNGTRLLS